MKRCTCAVIVLVLVTLNAVTAGVQMFPSNPDTKGVSAFLIAPSSGVKPLPDGWTRHTDDTYNNCALSGEYLSPAKSAGPVTTESYALPLASYDVYACVRGSGKVRLGGSDKWVEFNVPGNRYKWVLVGSLADVKRVSVEVAPAGGALAYAGLLAEGDKLPVKPVADVVAKMRKGEPVTICLLGDSVTENAKGFRGGSRNFQTGNPGLMKKYLEDEFKTPVAYISHREPPGWPDDGDPSKIKVIDWKGRKVRDGRVEVDGSKKIRLINMGKGGAASHDGWKRMPGQFTEPGEWRLIGGRWLDHRQPGAPPILRNGMKHYKPDLVIINFGTNDANGSHLKWTAKDYLFHMKVLATHSQRDLGAAVIVTTPHKWTKGSHQNPHTQPEMPAVIRDYAKKAGLALADIYAEYKTGEGDGIHPKNNGHRHMADAYMKALLGKAPPAPADNPRQFKDNGDGTVTDTGSSLVWAKDADIAGKTLTLDEAGATLAKWNAEKKFGFGDWRIPTRDELLAITGPAGYRTEWKEKPFVNVRRIYLSDSIGMKLRSGTFYWLVDVRYGMEFFPGRRAGSKGSLWPVRSNKVAKP